ncbi:hypothetical protein SADUNF_Sadunf14G0068900 [Salix dunnii]|uniref:Uncharacterized protein n=1 Tax=Salix dunnii TaxID=1413687 RepID=A0A835MM65_9ROSI|nr:hypothetical protein SADUNF_Sadunf14G0068900 [Salix dunnii]
MNFHSVFASLTCSLPCSVYSPVLFLGLFLWKWSLFCVLLLEVLACIHLLCAYELDFIWSNVIWECFSHYLSGLLFL